MVFYVRVYSLLVPKQLVMLELSLFHCQLLSQHWGVAMGVFFVGTRYVHMYVCISLVYMYVCMYV